MENCSVLCWEGDRGHDRESRRRSRRVKVKMGDVGEESMNWSG